jgi:hypothetical protein
MGHMKGRTQVTITTCDVKRCVTNELGAAKEMPRNLLLNQTALQSGMRMASMLELEPWKVRTCKPAHRGRLTEGAREMN